MRLCENRTNTCYGFDHDGTNCWVLENENYNFNPGTSSGVTNYRRLFNCRGGSTTGGSLILLDLSTYYSHKLCFQFQITTRLGPRSLSSNTSNLLTNKRNAINILMLFINSEINLFLISKEPVWIPLMRTQINISVVE